MRRPARFALALIATFPGLVAACPGLTVEHGWIRESPPGAPVAAAYLTFRNEAAGPLRIEGVASGRFAAAMFHETVHEGDRARMLHRHAIDVPAGGQVTLAPGGLHVMLMNPAIAPRAGEVIELEFKCGGSSLAVALPVVASDPATAP